VAARFRDLDLAEDAFAEACLASLQAWRGAGVPREPSAWLYRAACLKALDALRRRRVRTATVIEPPDLPPTPEEIMLDSDEPIPDERLRLIFICCHPALALEARAALTLKIICGLSTGRLARAFLMTEPAMLQRITRAKRKIRDAGVPFETPGREMWAERLRAVLATLEIAYAQAYEDAAGSGDAAGLGREALRLSGILAELLPDEPEVLGLAAMVRLAEARRPARVASDGAMVPLSEQDVALWDRELIASGQSLLDRAVTLRRSGPYQVMAAIHACHAERLNTGDVAWRNILLLYDTLARLRPSRVVSVNRVMALAEVAGPQPALDALDALADVRLSGWRPYHAARAACLAKAGRLAEAALALRAALALAPPQAERLFLEMKLKRCEDRIGAVRIGDGRWPILHTP
jgi:RNA polymerase sigma-70 factor (ECF subfamily)